MTFLAIAELRRVAPACWDWLPLRRVAMLRNVRNNASVEPLLALSSERGMERRPDDGGRQLPSEETIRDYWVVRPGDLVFNPMWAIGGGVAVSRIEGAVSPAYRVYRLGLRLVPRYLHYFLRSTTVIDQYSLMTRGLTTFDRSVSREDLEAMPVPLPPLNEQRAIADYLDAETARIDALVAARQRQVGLVDARLEAEIERWIEVLRERHGVVPLKRLAHRVEQGFSPECDGIPAEGEEWGVLKTSSVSSGVFNRLENKRLPDTVEPDPRWIVRDGDLLVVRGSGSPSAVGQAAVARVDGSKLLLSDLLYRVRLLDANPAFVAAALRSRYGRGQLEASIRTDVGMTRKIRSDDLGGTLVPAAPRLAQQEAIEALSRREERITSLLQRLIRQIDLLIERRQALITAAVTGQIEILGVAA